MIDEKNNTIKCPNCGTEIQVTQILAHDIEMRLKEEYNKKYFATIEKQRKKIEDEVKASNASEILKLKSELNDKLNLLKDADKKAEDLMKKEKELLEKEASVNITVQKKLEDERQKISEQVQEKYILEMKDLANQVVELNEKLNKSREAELEFKKLQRNLEEKEKSIDLVVEQKLSEEKNKLIALEKSKSEIEMKDLTNQVLELTNKLKESQAAELEFRRLQRELEAKEKSIDLVVEQKLSEELKKAGKEIEDRKNYEFTMKLKEKEEQIASMNKTIEELKQKSEQGSMQLQGEVQELALEELLSHKFPFDTIDPVPKGVRGADCIQKINNNYGEYCGTLIWESKRTKNWSNEWIQKLKEDKNSINADIAIIVSKVLPEGINHIGNIEGIWVSDFNSAFELAFILRESILQINLIKASQQGKGQKIEMLYDYLSGNEFRSKIETIIESFTSMKEDLDKEKTAMQKIWAKREKQIESVVKSTSQMYGALHGIMGKQLPEVKYFELPLTIEDEFDE